MLPSALWWPRWKGNPEKGLYVCYVYVYVMYMYM